MDPVGFFVEDTDIVSRWEAIYGYDGLPALSHVWQHVKLSDALVLGPVRDIT